MEMILEPNEYEIVYKHFQDMEKRYHTWMNYYAIFNGALLVAFTSGIKDDECLEICDKGTFLFLILILGIITTYCWYLSSIGHYAWLDDWRIKMQNLNPKIDKTISKNFDKSYYSICGSPVLPKYLSTNRITNVFILCVLYSWILMLVSVISMKFTFSSVFTSCGSISIWLLFVVFAKVMHKILGSHLTNFTQGNRILNRKDTFCTSICEWKNEILFMIALGLILICICEICKC